VSGVILDILEGCLLLKNCEILIYYILNKNLVSKEIPNHAWQTFAYGCIEIKDRPSKIDEAHIKKKMVTAKCSSNLVASSIPSCDD